MVGSRFKNTTQRAEILDEVRASAGHLTAGEIFERVRRRDPRIAYGTVYRTLQQLAEDGEVDVLRTSETESMYRRCSSGHHHHLVCRYCRHTVEVDSAAVERWASTSS